jgi:hypothetical protein
MTADENREAAIARPSQIRIRCTRVDFEHEPIVIEIPPVPDEPPAGGRRWSKRNLALAALLVLAIGALVAMRAGIGFGIDVMPMPVEAAVDAGGDA